MCHNHQEGYEPHLNYNDRYCHRTVKNCWIPLLQAQIVSKGKYWIHRKIVCKCNPAFQSDMVMQAPVSTKVVFDKGSGFKIDFTLLIKYFAITPICTSINNPQSNAPVERIHQVIYNMIVTKDIDRKICDYIDPCEGTLASLAWVLRASYHCTLGFTPGQTVFGRGMLFNQLAFLNR